MRITQTAGGVTYTDIRVGEGHGIHQLLLDVSNLYDETDDDGYLPVGFGVAANGTKAHASGNTVGMIGPEAVYIGTVTSTVDVFGNVIMTGVVNGDMITDNVGTAYGATLPSGLRVL